MKKSLLIAAGVALSAMPVGAQRLTGGYVTWPESQQLPAYVSAWNDGNGTITIDGKAWEDQNFFISRVKPRERFYNTETQVYTDITQWSASNKDGNDKRLAFWVPVSDEAREGQKLNALPDGSFDGEVFSMWNYVDNYGNWNAPYGFTPGAFADVCHKNGVGTHGVAAVPYGAIGDWRTTFTELSGLGADKVGKFLYYFGQDGLGYNSEWSSPSASSLGLISLHDGLASYMAGRNPLWEVMWYAGVTDNGWGNAFDQGIGSFTGLFKSSSMFLNYNWNNTSYITSSVNKAESMNRSPFYIYAGMNIQGGEPRSGSNYDMLKDYKYSIGLWGAHSTNMYWKDRFNNGSSPTAKANAYNKTIETWFGNGPRNPAIKKEITLNRTHRPNDDWAGMSSMMSARSTINWSLENETFYSYFNLGNGMFFNWMGERMHNNEWYNIGIQDYLPTWRFWFAPTWKGGQGAGMEGALTEADVKLNANFVWDDAYVGGSCLKVSGTTDNEFLHLFKTNLNWNTGGVTMVRFTYKLIAGKGDISLVFDGVNNAGTTKKYREYKFQTVESSGDVEDKSYLEGKDGWTTVEYQIPNSISMRRLYMVGLHFENAENLEMLIGGLVIDRNKTFTTPEAPQITMSKVLAYNSSGVDAKLIWNMPNKKEVGEPCYNSDVNASMFRMWAQQEGEEMQNYGATTSWAGIIFAAKVNNQGGSKMRFGVSAVSADMKSESEITWTDYMPMGEYVTSDKFVISKSVIKPGEKFEMSFVDPKHSSATWELYDESGTMVWSGEGTSVECPGMPAVGSYTLKMNYDGKTAEYPRYVAVSGEGVGALPEIYTLSIDDNDVAGTDAVEVTLNESKKFSYTGRKADGVASRGIDLNEKWFGVQCGEIGLSANKSFSVAAWIKYDVLPEGRSNFITIEDRTGEGWPFNNWGYFWSRINDEGKFLYNGVDAGWSFRTERSADGQRIYYRYDDAQINVNTWTHVAVVFEYQEGTNKVRCHFYINGVKQMVNQWVDVNKGSFQGTCCDDSETSPNWMNFKLAQDAGIAAAYGENTYEPEFRPHNYPITSNTWIAFGGSAPNISAVMGCVDDFQIWGKAMTQEDVKASMAGLDSNNLPADVLGFWSVETDPGVDNGFLGAVGANATMKTPKAYWYSIGSGGENDNERIKHRPNYLTGSPFITGSAYPIVTKPTWTTRRASVNGDGTGETGSADIAWTKPGDYAVQLKLANGHGEATMDYPVVKVKDSTQGIGDIDVDGEGFSTYTIEDALFVEFEGDGKYKIEVFNMAGMTVGGKTVEAVAGQNASVRLGAAGVYLVKVSRDGQLLRTVKVIRK